MRQQSRGLCKSRGKISNFNETKDICYRMQKFLVLKETPWYTTPLHFYKNKDVIFKYSTSNEDYYIGIMKGEKTYINNTVSIFNTFKRILSCQTVHHNNNLTQNVSILFERINNTQTPTR